MRENNRLLNKLDWATVGIYLLLVFIGWISIYSAVYNDEHTSIFDFSQRYGKQLVWIVAAVLIAAFVMLTDTKVYSVFSYYIYAAIIFLLIFVLVAGTEVNGSRSWFVIGQIRMQPAELAKVATALALARLMSTHGFSLQRRSHFLKIAFIIGLPVFFIFLQHDTGSALVFGAFLLMLYREGLSGWLISGILFAIVVFIVSILWQPISVLMLCLIASLLVYTYLQWSIRQPLIIATAVFGLYFLTLNFIFPRFAIDNFPSEYLFLSICGVAAVVNLIYAVRKKMRYVWFVVLFFAGSVLLTNSVDYVFDNILKQHQRDRIDDLLGVKEDLQGFGYNVHQSKVAIGSGGFFGKGFLQGTQTRYNFVPEQSTDFIFCTIGEEWGFVGTLATVVIYLTLLFRLIIISERQKDIFARIYGYCVTSILFFHFAVNIAMTIGLAPVIGIPLPFLSYGGSSLWAFTLLLFILLKMDAVRWK